MAQTAKKVKRYTNLYVKRRLVQLEVDVFGTISKAMVSRTGKQVVLNQMKQQIYNIAVQLHLDQAEADVIWAKFTNLYQDVLKKTAVARRKRDPQLIQEATYRAIRPQIIQDVFLKDANEIVRHYEQRLKQERIDEMLESSSDSPFFLCSAHPNPAKDHADWQGRMYYDENWDQNRPDAASIRAYIKNHKLRSVQWVIGPPVYMTIRPNCKHFFRQIPVEEVLHASAKSLLKKHKLYIADQEPASEKRLYYRQYYNRLKVEEELKKHIQCPSLEQDILHNRKLMQKWS